MKTPLLAILGILCASRVLAEEATAIDSKVIHRYSYVNLSLGYVPARDSDYVGIRFDGSFEYKNCLFWLKAGEFSDVFDDLTHVNGGIGYAIRLDRNRINILPRLGVSYLEITESDLSDDSTTIKSTALEPSITFSYAFSGRFSLDAGYALAARRSSVSQLNLGAAFAFAKHWVVRIESTLASDRNYNGLFAGVAFHF